jgi:hypothetical protein
LPAFLADAATAAPDQPGRPSTETEADVTSREKDEQMERARDKRRRRKGKAPPEAPGVVRQATRLAAGAAKAVGAAVKSAADAVTGT